MAPAGSFESLRAAIEAGAGSVYFGVGQLNMRAAAANFKDDDLHEVAEICRENGVNSYLTVNTVIYDDDLTAVRSLIKKAAEAGVSAIIAMDIAAMKYARNLDMSVHLSTQMNVSNIEAVRFFSRFADVVVLARELELRQIENICSGIAEGDIRGPSGELVEVEVFIHGALCIAISGKCHMSLAQFGHSANRGDCYQSCRRTYTVTDDVRGQQMKLDNHYVMSPSDLCTLGMLEDLVATGAGILKIEGRGRSAEYVGTVVSAYGRALDLIAEGEYDRQNKEDLIQKVRSVYNRGFWHGGYYLGRKTDEWAGVQGSKATHRKVFLGVATNYYANNGIGEFQLQTGELSIGEHLLVTGPTTGAVQFDAHSIHDDRGPAKKAVKGQNIGIPVPRKIRPNDKLFAIRPVDDS